MHRSVEVKGDDQSGFNFDPDPPSLINKYTETRGYRSLSVLYICPISSIWKLVFPEDFSPAPVRRSRDVGKVKLSPPPARQSVSQSVQLVGQQLGRSSRSLETARFGTGARHGTGEELLPLSLGGGSDRRGSNQR